MCAHTHVHKHTHTYTHTQVLSVICGRQVISSEGNIHGLQKSHKNVCFQSCQKQKERPTFSDHNICLIYIIYSLRDILVITQVLPVTKHVRKTQKHLDTILVPRDWLSLRISKVKYGY